jgi:hypothetical protein
MVDKPSVDSFQQDIKTKAAFDAVLGELIVAALENGVNPRGSWVYRNSGPTPDLEVMMVQLEKEEN